MKNYTFAEQLGELYEKAGQLYAQGQRGADTYFKPVELEFLAANGLTAQNLYDYAEDDAGGNGPGWDNALPIESVRRDYFINVQGGKPSGQVLDVETMPAKTDAVRSIEWLPRIIPKTKAKLRGELPPSLMYCCSGDRRFFQEHDINPAEFLTLVWRNIGNDNAVIDWVVKRSTAK